MPGIREFDQYLRTKLRPLLLKAYRDFEILSEADLQALAWSEMTKYLRGFPKVRHKYHVANKLYCKDVRLHPDITVLKRNRPVGLLRT